MNSKILVIGLDGATFDIIKPMVKEGRLPHIQKLMMEGSHGILRSTPEPNSPNAWSTFVTGKNAGKHGIFGFFEVIPGTYNVGFVNGSFRRGKSLWKILSENGKRVGVIHVPTTYPAEEVNGFMISGSDSPNEYDPDFTFPKGLISEVEKKAGKYIIESGASALVRQGKLDKALEGLHESIRQRTSTAKFLFREYPSDFFMTVFTETDRVQHHFWKFINPRHPAYGSETSERYREAIYAVYERVDASIGELVDLVGDEYTVFIMSDHGQGPSSNKTLFLNRWLASAGYLTFRSKGGLRRLGKGSMEELVGNAYLYARRSLSRKWKKRLRYLLPGLRNKAHSVLSGLNIEWANTKAFSYENFPAIYINLKGKFPQGLVEPGGEYERVLDQLTRGLFEIESPDNGNRIVHQVYRKEEIYAGPFLDKAPDLIFSFKDDAYTIRPGYTSKGNDYIECFDAEAIKEVEIVGRPSGVHTIDGVFIAKGEDIHAGEEIDHVYLYDLTSTILYLCGASIPVDFDGRVINEIFDDACFKAKPIRRSDGESLGEVPQKNIFGDKETDIIAERLRGLGYID